MVRFIIQFVIIALVLGVSVWFGLPFLYVHLADSQTSASEQAQPSGKASSGAENITAPEIAALAQKAPAEKSPAEAVIRPLAVTAAMAATEKRQVSANPSWPRIAAEESPAEWGIVGARTVLYDFSGKPLANAPGGLLVKVSGEMELGDQPCMICELVNPPANAPKGRVLIPRAALALYAGRYGLLPPEQLAQLRKFFAFTARINLRAEELRKELTDRNPHHEQYQALYEADEQHAGMLKRLTEARQKASGALLARIDEKLRELGEKQRKNRRDLLDAQTKYKAWLEEHPQNDLCSSWADENEIAEMLKSWRELNVGIEPLANLPLATLNLERRIAVDFSKR